VVFPFTVNGSNAGLTLNVFQAAEGVGIVTLAVYKGSQRQGRPSGTLPMNSIIRFGSQEFRTLIDMTFTGSSYSIRNLIPGGPRAINPFPSLDDRVRIVALGNALGAGRAVWARLEAQDVGENIRQDQGGPAVIAVETCTYVVDIRTLNVTIDSRITDQEAKDWQVVGLTYGDSRQYATLNCQREVT